MDFANATVDVRKHLQTKITDVTSQLCAASKSWDERLLRGSIGPHLSVCNAKTILTWG